MQVTYFKKGIRTMTEKRVVETGISPLASFFLSSAMRVGPGNILGVTGAIAVGGPGALFWMWISAFFGMATPDPRSSMIAKDIFPRIGILLYQSKFVGNSHRKSDSGPIKLNTPLKKSGGEMNEDGCGTHVI